jgi:spermidine synthase
MTDATVDTELMLSLTNSNYTETACSAETASVYRIDRALWAGKTYCSETVIAVSPEFGKVLFLDKELQSAESDEAIYHEHLIHPVLNTMAERQGLRVLIVGGGEGATAREVLRWSSVSHLDWVDIDVPLVELCRRHLQWADDEVYNDPRLTYHGTDIRRFLQSCSTHYDVIVLDLPDPDVDTLGTSTVEDPVDYPLYGSRFWTHLKTVLAAGGAIVSHTGPIRPGGDAYERREGLAWIQDTAAAAGLGRGYPYHVGIPSFMGEWGFWMSVPPRDDVRGMPAGLRVMDADAQRVAFTWPRYWNVGNQKRGEP